MPTASARVGRWVWSSWRTNEPQLGEGRVTLDVDPGDLAELADDHQHRDAGHIADQHRTGQEIGQEPQPAEPAQDAQQSDGDRQRRRGLGVAFGVPRHHGPDRRGRHQRGRGLGPDRELARRAEDGVDRQRRDDGPQTGDRRQTGNFGVRHHLGDEVRGHRHPGDHIAAQPDALILAQHPQTGEQSSRRIGALRNRGLGRHTTNLPVRPYRTVQPRRVVFNLESQRPALGDPMSLGDSDHVDHLALGCIHGKRRLLARRSGQRR